MWEDCGGLEEDYGRIVVGQRKNLRNDNCRRSVVGGAAGDDIGVLPQN